MVCLKKTIYPCKFLKGVFHKFYLVHSWILCPKYSSDSAPFSHTHDTVKLQITHNSPELHFILKPVISQVCNCVNKETLAPRHRCFSVNFAKFLRTPFFTKHLCWLLLITIIRIQNSLFLWLFLYFIR